MIPINRWKTSEYLAISKNKVQLQAINEVSYVSNLIYPGSLDRAIILPPNQLNGISIGAHTVSWVLPGLPFIQDEGKIRGPALHSGQKVRSSSPGNPNRSMLGHKQGKMAQ